MLRGFYSQRFLDSDGVTPVLAGNGVDGFYYQWACSRDVDGNLIVPEIQIHSTDDGIDVQTSLFTGQLYVDDSPSQVIFGQPQAGAGWIIAASLGSPITWGDLDIYNQGRTLFPSGVYTYLTAALTVALIRQMIASIDPASTTALGLVELSFAAAIPSAPVVLTQGDPAVGDLHGSLTINKVSKASSEKVLVDSLISDNGSDISAQTIGTIQLGDYGYQNNGSHLSLSDTFGQAALFAGGGTVPDLAAQYAGVEAVCSDSNSEIFVQTTNYTNLYGNSDVTQIGDGTVDNNGTMVQVDDTNLTVTSGDVYGAGGETTLQVDDTNGVVEVEASNGMFVNGEEVYTIPSIPNIDLTPTSQEIVDALLALGLVTQS